MDLQHTTTQEQRAAREREREREELGKIHSNMDT